MHALWLLCCLLGSPNLSSAVTPFNHPSLFILCEAADPQGDVWVGTESDGIWRCAPNGHWTRFTTEDGLSENSGTAIVCDSQDRIWVGHRQTGVSVFNGKTWRNYGTLTGPLGDRIFALASNPINGDVWMATDRGLARWAQTSDTWSYFTRAEGLPDDQASSLAFASDGTLYVGTQADGIAIGSPDDDYQTWKIVHGPAQSPDSPQGFGLPSPLINTLLVAHDGTVYVGTDDGLAGSRDGGKTWRYLRGEDWLAKAQQQAVPPVRPLPSPKEELMTEDYVTSLAEDSAGLLWIGHRHTGTELYDPRTGLHAPLPNLPLFDYVRAVLAPDGIIPWIGGYGGGIFAPGPAPVLAAAPAIPPAFPTSAAALTVDQLAQITQDVENNPTPLPTGAGEFLGDDWNMQGDWVGHYGAQYARLYGVLGVGDQVYSREPGYTADVDVGPHSKPGNAVWYYISKLSTDDPRVLYDPAVSARRDAEINDGSWQHALYPIAYQGPDLWVTVQVPSGLQRISFYFDNDDGHTVNSDGIGDNRLRDYTLELMPGSASPANPATQTDLAKTRVFDFYEGVYKQFLVQGPATFQFRIGRNHSFVTKLQGIFIDRLNVDPVAAPEGLGNQLSAAEALWVATNSADSNVGGAALDSEDRVLAYRAAVAAGAPSALISDWRITLDLWSAQERASVNASLDASATNK